MKRSSYIKIAAAASFLCAMLFFTCKKTDYSSNNNTNSYPGGTTGGTTGTTTGGTTSGSTTYATTTGGTTSGTTTGNSTPAQITLTKNSFSPSTFTVSAGTTVTWVNKDENTIHTVTSADKIFNSGDLRTGENYSHTFGTVGVFSYYCIYHKSMGMTGSITVVAAK